MSQPIHVLIAERNCTRRATLRASTESAGDMIVVDDAGEVKEAILKTSIWQPDVLLLDLSLTKQEMMQFVRTLEAIAPHTRVLILAEEWTPSVYPSVPMDKVAGYLLKSVSATELLMAIRIIYHGGTVLPLGLIRTQARPAHGFTGIVHRFSSGRFSAALRQIWSGST